MDETENKQDTSEKDSSVSNQETSEQAQTFTKESQEKAVSDALSKVGRTDKALTDRADRLAKAITAGQTAQDKWRADRRKAEEEDAKGDTDTLRNIDRKYTQDAKDSAQNARQVEQDQRDKDYEEAQKVDAQSTKEQNAREIATRLGVDHETLAKFADSKEDMEALAEKLNKGTETSRPDSGGTTGGGGGIPTDKRQFEQWLNSLSAEEFEKRSVEINEMMKQDRIK